MNGQRQKIILDFGSGNTCKNSRNYVREMYDELKKVDSKKYEIIIKWQLFKHLGSNIPLTEDCFNFAYEYGVDMGYEVTASVFDRESLNFLLLKKIPFIKLANRRELDFLATMIPVKIPLYVSKNSKLFIPRKENIKEFWCISRYPATIEEYSKLPLTVGCNISDHTSDFKLFNKWKPAIVEWHYKLINSTGLDSGDFARTPEQLSEIL